MARLQERMKGHPLPEASDRIRWLGNLGKRVQPFAITEWLGQRRLGILEKSGSFASKREWTLPACLKISCRRAGTGIGNAGIWHRIANSSEV